MDNSSTTTKLLQAILDELRSQKQQLGFGHPPKSCYIYANRKYSKTLWYFWNSALNEPEPIEFHALTGTIESLEIESKEFRGKTEQKVNLHILAERKYIIQAGSETQFAKGLLYALLHLPPKALTQPLTIAVEAGDTELVLFCRVYDPATGQSIYAPYPENTNWEKIAKQVIAKIEQVHGQITPPDCLQATATKSKDTAVAVANPNRELLKRVGQITEHSNKQIATIIQENFPGLKSDRLSELEVRAVVDAMCIDVAVRVGINESKAVVAFGEWQASLNPETGNEQLAQLWMKQIELLTF